MAKKINVETHLARYNGTSINDKIKLIEGLQKQIDGDRQRLIDDMKSKLAILEQGGLMPEEEPEEEQGEEAIVDGGKDALIEDNIANADFEETVNEFPDDLDAVQMESGKASRPKHNR